MHDDRDLIPEALTAAMVRSYIDFDGHGETSEPGPQARLQSEGVAALWHLLETKSFAYLADEVGMGKTRQAMGIIATQFLRKPDSHVAIICPGEALQRQWESEWSDFLRNCYRLLDERLLGADGRQLEPLQAHENLRDFARALRNDEGRIHLLRYSSFSWPLALGREDLASMMARYAATAGVDGEENFNPQEQAIATHFAGRRSNDDSRHELTRALAETYCARIAALLTHGTVQDEQGGRQPHRKLDLVICDEAQYLRHPDNFRNQCIARIFRGNAGRWLFMSATPLHAGQHDIKSLDHYLCCKTAPDGDAAFPQACGSCGHAKQCSRAAWQLERNHDAQPLLKQMMVRRIRAYADGDRKEHFKTAYRHYEPVRYSGVDDAFYALTMALAQKQLAIALTGNNNRFRQGECASFESLSSSVGHGSKPPEPAREYETKKDGRRPAELHVAPDRNRINELNHSFCAAMSAPDAMLPHAKLNNAVDTLFERSLRGASNDKTLVFVRRIDTVGEICDLLRVRFQQEIDARIVAWRDFLEGGGSARLWAHGGFWESPADEADVGPMEEEETSGEEQAAPEAGSSYREPVRLKYFDALRRAPVQAAGGDAVGQVEKTSKLAGFRGRLLNGKDPSTNPLRGFLLKRQETDADGKNHGRWLKFLEAVLGAAGVEMLRTRQGQEYLFGTAQEGDAAWKRGALQRCLLESMRHSDFIVDLYILHAHLARTPDGGTELPEKLLWLLNNEDGLEPVLAGHIRNWKKKFRSWIEYFDVIAAKSFRGGTQETWQEICRERVKTAFHGVAPAAGRSSRMQNKHAVAQFNFPSHPNVLICTDVLKEGVDMHLFCDQIVHYGVAWTSGDLEQRIGRIDRLGSLIGRRIEGHSQQASGDLPRLAVKFPYLDGTLDSHQVRRVVDEKLASDQRMDLGRRAEESGELNAATLGMQAPPRVAAAVATAFFPECAKFTLVAGGSIAWPGRFVRQAGQQVRPWQAGDEACGETPLPVLGCSRVLGPVEDGAKLARRSQAGEAAEQLRAEILVPAGGVAMAAELPREACPAAVLDSPNARFGFCGVVNTLVWLPQIEVCGTGMPRRMLLETIGGAVWLLRVGVCAAAAARKDFGPVMARENRARRWGYLAQDAGEVWFCVMVQAAGEAWDLLARLAERLPRAARYYRDALTAGGAWEEPDYRSPRAFPAATNFSAAITQGISGMKHEDLLRSGQWLAGIHGWFSDVFAAVLDALYDDAEPSVARGLETEPLTCHEGGLLHLRTKGAERFAVQAYLDLGGVLGEENIFAGPKMLWELAVTPHATGPAPELELHTLDEFPHAGNPDWEEGTPSGQCSAFTYAKQYRYLAVYHTPQAWARESNKLLAAWREVRATMHEYQNFQRQSCRDAFFEALGELPGIV